MVSVEWDRPLILVHNLSLPILSVTLCYFHTQISNIISCAQRATFTSWDKQANGSFRFRLSLQDEEDEEVVESEESAPRKYQSMQIERLCGGLGKWNNKLSIQIFTSQQYHESAE